MDDIRSPRIAAEVTIRLFRASSDNISVYWVPVVGNREAYAAELRQLVFEHPILPIIWRGDGFNNPNSIVEDVVAVLEDHMPDCMEALTRCTDSKRRIGLVMIARSRFALGQSSSPAILPPWFTDGICIEGHCNIVDLTWQLEADMSARELTRMPDLHRALYAVEGALTRRLIEVNSHDSKVQEEFFRHIKRTSDVSWDAFLADAARDQRAIPNAAAYRPSRRDGLSVVSRLWEMAQKYNGKMRRECATLLEAALSLTDVVDPHDHYSLISTLLSHTITPSYGENLIQSTFATCQVFTLEAHAEVGRMYPIDYLALLIEDLYKSLVSAETVVINLPPIRSNSGGS